VQVGVDRRGGQVFGQGLGRVDGIGLGYPSATRASPGVIFCFAVLLLLFAFQSVDQLIDSAVKKMLMIYPFENGVFQFFELSQSVQGAPEHDRDLIGINRPEHAARNPLADKPVDQLEDQAALVIDLRLQFGSERDLGCGQKVIDNIEIVFLLTAEPQVGHPGFTKFLVGSGVGSADGINFTKEDIQPLVLERIKDLLFALVVKIDRTDAEFSHPGNLVDAGGLKSVF
jgi:hypothetical protein